MQLQSERVGRSGWMADPDAERLNFESQRPDCSRSSQFKAIMSMRRKIVAVRLSLSVGAVSAPVAAAPPSSDIALRADSVSANGLANPFQCVQHGHPTR
jgi:hypothetical protein